MSSVSSSCRTAPPHVGQASGSSTATMVSGHASQYHTGMRWPHQIWRLMVQSRMFSIQWKYVRSKRLGTNEMRPSRTASMAGRASGSARTNHCSEMIGSTIVPERWQ